MSMHTDRNYFKDYKDDCEIFLETGTYVGSGITLAVLAGFTEIHSIDIADQIPPEYKHGLKEIYRYIGDSAEVLKGLLPKINKKCMMWLDAHSQLNEGEEENYPLLRELHEIAKHKIKNHTILIDDFLFMSHKDVTGWSKEMIEAAISKINPKYKIEYLPNPIVNNILIARV